jgi:hypothetical protein
MHFAFYPRVCCFERRPFARSCNPERISKSGEWIESFGLEFGGDGYKHRQMAEISYDWKRYWVPREGRMPCDDSGFLIPPASEASWAKWYSTDASEFEELNKKSCLVLLGEPGIGKSFALKDAEASARKSAETREARFLTRNLNIFDDGKHLVTDIFESPDFKWWEGGAGELHLFFALIRWPNCSPAALWR